jgi:hypothetical protein
MHTFKLSLVFLAITSIVAACSTAKIEARLEANPRCKDVINPKTGALMPCPESDKAFYKAIGLAPNQPSAVMPITAADASISLGKAPTSNINSNPLMPPTQDVPKQNDCKQQIHKKTGGILPCPALD